ncbi:hypothetical protein M0657_000729 [Pyricularia oryzae]|nr:hypothetical protein M9X92_002254 [Pyricularia oryzae]KAI7932290.1 hypothetical protein M0657_000729 [Pyricularia oryzae]
MFCMETPACLGSPSSHLPTLWQGRPSPAVSSSRIRGARDTLRTAGPSGKENAKKKDQPSMGSVSEKSAGVQNGSNGPGENSIPGPMLRLPDSRCSFQIKHRDLGPRKRGAWYPSDLLISDLARDQTLSPFGLDPFDQSPPRRREVFRPPAVLICVTVYLWYAGIKCVKGGEGVGGPWEYRDIKHISMVTCGVSGGNRHMEGRDCQMGHTGRKPCLEQVSERVKKTVYGSVGYHREG